MDQEVSGSTPDAGSFPTYRATARGPGRASQPPAGRRLGSRAGGWEFHSHPDRAADTHSRSERSARPAVVRQNGDEQIKGGEADLAGAVSVDIDKRASAC